MSKSRRPQSSSQSSSRSAVDVVTAIKALADPVRWGIAERLASGPRSASELGEGFDISAPAVSRHLKVLLGGGIVDVESKGRQRVYSLRAETLEQLSSGLGALAGSRRKSSSRKTPKRRSRPKTATPAQPSDWRSW